MSEENNIPKHWQIKTLGEVCEKVEKVNRKGKDLEEDLLYLDIGGIDNNTNKILTHKSYKWKNAPSRAQQIVFIDDILFSTVRTYMKNIALVENRIFDGQIASSGFCVIRGKHKIISSKFIFYYSISQSFLQPLNELQTGSSYPAVRDKDVFSQPIPIPPITEQQAIVSKIEELLSDLDNGKQQLLLAQQQLKVYRQSLLKWAFEGKLTNKDVKDGELPKGWKWVKLKDVAKEISDGDHQAPPKAETGIPFITISNVNKSNSKIDFTDTFKVNNDYYRSLKPNRKPQKGDVLYTVTGSFGIPILIDFEKEFCFQRHIGLIRPLDTTNQKWIYYLLQSPQVFNQAKETATGTAQKTVALSSLRSFNIPLCQTEEQQLIVDELESKLTVCDKIEETISQSLLQAESLRQSILKKAFEGKLV